MAKNDCNKTNLKCPHKKSLTWFFWIPASVILIGTILIVISQMAVINKVTSNSKLNSTNYLLYKQSLEKFSEIGQYTNINGVQYFLNEEDLENLQNAIFAIDAQMDFRIESMNENFNQIIDTITLYISIAVILLTLIPIGFQIASQNELRSRINEIEESIKDIDKKSIDDMANKIKDSEDKLHGIQIEISKLQNIENQIEDLTTQSNKIPPLALEFLLQQAVNKDALIYYQNIDNAKNFLQAIFQQINEEIQDVIANKNSIDINGKRLKTALELFTINIKLSSLFTPVTLPPSGWCTAK